MKEGDAGPRAGERGPAGEWKPVLGPGGGTGDAREEHGLTGREVALSETDQIDPMINRVLKNTYSVTEVIRSGGMGTVYRADHLRLPIPLAIKILREDLAGEEEFLEKFRREAVIQALVKHPGAVSIVDMDVTADGRAFLVMEFCPGKPLSDLLRDQGALPLERSLGIIQQLLQILVVAHDAGIVHRDLKPENIMVEELEDGRDRVRILDFGIATLLEDVRRYYTDRNNPSAVWGSPYYVSPEQALGKTVDARADLYSTGVILFEMLTGHLPLDDENLERFYSRLLNEPPPQVSERARQRIPARVDDAVATCLAKDPVFRPRDGRELLERLFPTREGAARWPWIIAIVAAAIVGTLAGLLLARM